LTSMSVVTQFTAQENEVVRRVDRMNSIIDSRKRLNSTGMTLLGDNADVFRSCQWTHASQSWRTTRWSEQLRQAAAKLTEVPGTFGAVSSPCTIAHYPETMIHRSALPSPWSGCILTENDDDSVTAYLTGCHWQTVWTRSMLHVKWWETERQRVEWCWIRRGEEHHRCP
jgi:hypothetical protein